MTAGKFIAFYRKICAISWCGRKMATPPTSLPRLWTISFTRSTSSFRGEHPWAVYAGSNMRLRGAWARISSTTSLFFITPYWLKSSGRKNVQIGGGLRPLNTSCMKAGKVKLRFLALTGSLLGTDGKVSNWNELTGLIVLH